MFSESCKCGVNNLRHRVVGGVDAEKGEVPWQVQIKYFSKITNKYRHLCGGSLLSSDTVLTAAHCIDKKVVGVDMRDMTVVVGEHDLTKDEGTEQTSAIKDLIKHPDWNISDTDNDYD